MMNYNLTAKELAGRTFYVTSKYSKNIPFKIDPIYLFSHEVYVDTWEGRSASDNRPMGRIKGRYTKLSRLMKC